jgi:hypothetical protein
MHGRGAAEGKSRVTGIVARASLADESPAWNKIRTSVIYSSKCELSPGLSAGTAEPVPMPGSPGLWTMW